MTSPRPASSVTSFSMSVVLPVFFHPVTPNNRGSRNFLCSEIILRQMEILRRIDVEEWVDRALRTRQHREIVLLPVLIGDEAHHLARLTARQEPGEPPGQDDGPQAECRVEIARAA